MIVRQCLPVSVIKPDAHIRSEVGSSRTEMFPMIALLASSSRVHLSTLLFVFPRELLRVVRGPDVAGERQQAALVQVDQEGPGHLALDVFAARSSTSAMLRISSGRVEPPRFLPAPSCASLSVRDTPTASTTGRLRSLRVFVKTYVVSRGFTCSLAHIRVMRAERGAVGPLYPWRERRFAQGHPRARAPGAAQIPRGTGFSPGAGASRTEGAPNRRCTHVRPSIPLSSAIFSAWREIAL